MQTRQISSNRSAPSFNRLALCLAGAALVGVAAFAILAAQAQSANAEQISSLEAQAAYDERTLQSFATAAATVLALRNNYYPRIRAAEIAGAQDRADTMFKEMREHMHAAVGNSGFSIDQYRAISNAAKSDATLRARINTIIQGPPPAQQHVKKVARVTPQAPQIAAAPSNTALAPTLLAPATPAPAAPPIDDGVRRRLETELHKTNDERDRYQAEQLALQEKVQQLEGQLSSVKAKDSALREQLSAKKKQALAEQQKSKAQLDVLQGEVTNLKDKLAYVQSEGSTLRDLLAAETLRADRERSAKEAKLAAFRGEIKRLADSLSAARHSLDLLATDFNPGETGQWAPAFEALTPLRTEPNSIERVLAKTQPAYAKRQELDEEIARNQRERVRREAERNIVQQEIAELSRDLATTYQAMAELIGEPATTIVAAADLDIENDTYTLDVSQETALLFAGTAPQFDQARADPQADILLDEPRALDTGDPGIEQSALKPADSAALEPITHPAQRINRAPAVQIATVSAPVVVAPDVASPPEDAPPPLAALPAADPEVSLAAVQPARRVVRDERAFEPASPPKTEPQSPNAMPPEGYSDSVSGGAAAYRAADYRRAYEIWAPLAETGSRSAQFHLGALYFEGRGTDAGTDFSRAHFWLRLAARQGDQRAATLLAAVAEKLTLEEIRGSEDQAQEWLNKRSVKVTQNKRTGEDSQ